MGNSVPEMSNCTTNSDNTNTPPLIENADDNNQTASSPNITNNNNRTESGNSIDIRINNEVISSNDTIVNKPKLEPPKDTIPRATESLKHFVVVSPPPPSAFLRSKRNSDASLINNNMLPTDFSPQRRLSASCSSRSIRESPNASGLLSWKSNKDAHSAFTFSNLQNYTLKDDDKLSPLCNNDSSESLKFPTTSLSDLSLTPNPKPLLPRLPTIITSPININNIESNTTIESEHDDCFRFRQIETLNLDEWFKSLESIHAKEIKDRSDIHSCYIHEKFRCNIPITAKKVIAYGAYPLLFVPKNHSKDSLCWLKALTKSQAKLVLHIMNALQIQSTKPPRRRPFVTAIRGKIGTGKSAIAQSVIAHPQLSSLFSTVVSFSYPFTGLSELNFWNHLRLALLTRSNECSKLAETSLLSARGLFSPLEAEAFEIFDLKEARTECSSYPFRLCRENAFSDEVPAKFLPDSPVKIFLVLDDIRDENVIQWCMLHLPSNYTIIFTTSMMTVVPTNLAPINPSESSANYSPINLTVESFLSSHDNFADIITCDVSYLSEEESFEFLIDSCEKGLDQEKISFLENYGSVNEWKCLANFCNGSMFLLKLMKSTVNHTFCISDILHAVKSSIDSSYFSDIESTDPIVIQNALKLHFINGTEPLTERDSASKSNITFALYDYLFNTLLPHQILLLRFCGLLSIFSTVSGMPENTFNLSFLMMCLNAHNQSISGNLGSSIKLTSPTNHTRRPSIDPRPSIEPRQFTIPEETMHRRRHSAAGLDRRPSVVDDSNLNWNRSKVYSFSSLVLYPIEQIFNDLVILNNLQLVSICIPSDYIIPSSNSVWGSSQSTYSKFNWLSNLHRKESDLFLFCHESLRSKLRPELISTNMLPLSAVNVATPVAFVRANSIAPSSPSLSVLVNKGVKSPIISSPMTPDNTVNFDNSHTPSQNIKVNFPKQNMLLSASINSINYNCAKSIIAHLISVFDMCVFSIQMDSIFPTARCLLPYLNYQMSLLKSKCGELRQSLDLIHDAAAKFRNFIGLSTALELLYSSNISSPIESDLGASSRFKNLAPKGPSASIKPKSPMLQTTSVQNELNKSLNYVIPTRQESSTSSLVLLHKKLQSQSSMCEIALFAVLLGYLTKLQRLNGIAIVNESAEELIWICGRVGALRLAGAALYIFFDLLVSSDSSMTAYMISQKKYNLCYPGWLSLHKEQVAYNLCGQNQLIDLGHTINSATYLSRSLYLSLFNLLPDVDICTINRTNILATNVFFDFVDSIPNFSTDFIAKIMFDYAVSLHYCGIAQLAFEMYHMTILVLSKTFDTTKFAGNSHVDPSQHSLFGYVIHNLSILFLFSSSKFMSPKANTFVPPGFETLVPFLPPRVIHSCVHDILTSATAPTDLSAGLLSYVLSCMLQSFSQLDTLGGQNRDLLQICYNAGLICTTFPQFMAAPETRHELVPPSSIDPYSQAKNAIASNALKTLELGDDAVDFLSLNRCWWFLIRHGGWFIDAAHQTAFVGLLQVVFRKKIAHTTDSSALPLGEHSEGHQKLIEMLPSWLAILPPFEAGFLSKLFKFACEQGISSLVGILFGYDKNILNYRDAEDKTGLIYAATNGHTELVTVFCHHAPRLINLCDSSEFTALHYACKQGYIECVKVLLSYNCDPNAADKYNRTAMFLACQQSNSTIVSLLIVGGAMVNISENKYNQTPLMVASRYDNLATILICLNAGAAIKATDVDGRNCFHLAAKVGNIASCILILSFCSEWVNASNILPHCELFTTTFTPEIPKDKLISLPDAAFNYPDILSYIQKQDSEGRTALSLACEFGHLSVVKFLLKIGADMSIEDLDGKTPFTYAISMFRKEIVEFLVDQGAKLGENEAEYSELLFKVLSQPNEESLDDTVPAVEVTGFGTDPIRDRRRRSLVGSMSSFPFNTNRRQSSSTYSDNTKSTTLPPALGSLPVLSIFSDSTINFLHPIELLMNKIFQNNEDFSWHSPTEKIILNQTSVHPNSSNLGKFYSHGLKLASLKGHTDNLRLLLPMLSPYSLFVTDSDNITPAHFLCRYDHVNGVDFIMQLNSRCDLTIVSKAGLTALDEAIENYKPETILRLCSISLTGVDKRFWENGREGMEAKNPNEIPCNIVSNLYPDTFNYESTTLSPSRDGIIPFDETPTPTPKELSFELEIKTTSLQDFTNTLPFAFPPKILLNTKTNISFTPLAKPSSRSIVFCAARGWYSLLHVLIVAGGDSSAIDFKQSALMHATIHGHHYCVLLLLIAKANVNFATYDGITALMLAAGKGYPWIVKALLSAGADSALTDTQGRAAINWARQFDTPSHQSIVKLLTN